MAKIPLRLYDREIENLIDRGQIEEAIAHCKFILQIFPKHIDTYRLLGKAYLESQRYGDAADIFQRVLSVIPDDFVSQVGMSIIREDEGKLDLAIWHMERAFEVQSANTAVQEELKRLYSRRDGVEPPKVRLTRGALVRMYARGDLYQQAIAEIRSALAEDPQRIDMQVLLARMYALAGQKVEAAEVCSTVLKQYPFCLEANRILAEILPSTNRAEDTGIYKQRITALDPYFAAMTTETGSLADLPDNLVTLERLEWDPMQELGLNQPHWADTLGIKLEEQPATQIPDWLISDTTSSSPRPAFLEGLDHLAQPAGQVVSENPEPAAEGILPQVETPSIEGSTEPVEDQVPVEPQVEVPLPSANMDLIPGWMKEAGWVTSDKNFDEIEAALSLAGEAPSETEEEDGEEQLAPAEIPDWLLAMAPADLPEKKSDSASTLGLVNALADRSDDGLPQGVGEEAAGIPDWLTPVIETPEPAAVISPTTAPSGEVTSDLDLDRLFLEAGLSEQPSADAQPVEPPVITPTLEGTPPVTPGDGQEEALAWLEGLAAKHGAPEETLTTRPEDRPEIPPSWIQEAESSIAETDQIAGSLEPTHEEGPVEEDRLPEELPAWLQTVQLDGEEQESLTTDEGEGTQEEKPELPAWLQQLEIEEESISSEAEAFPSEQAGAEGIQAVELPDWLSSFAAAQEPASVEQEAEPEAEAEAAAAPGSELPAWLVELKATSEEEVEILSTEQPLAEVEIQEPQWVADSPMETGANLLTFAEEPAFEAELIKDEFTALEEVPAEAPEAGLLEPELHEAVVPLAELPDEELHPVDLHVEELPVSELLPSEPSEFQVSLEIPVQEEHDELQIVSSLEEEAPAVSDWVQEFNPVEETKPVEGELPISEWKPPEDFELPPELADLVASIERERAAMEAAGAAPEPITGPALNIPIDMDQEATQAWLDEMATVHTSEAKTVALRSQEHVERPPKWVEDGKAPPTQSLVGAPTQQPTPEEELPAWLRNLEDEDIIPEIPKLPEEQAADQLPAWLQGLEDADIEAPIAPTDIAVPAAAVETLGRTEPLPEIDLPDIHIFEVPQELEELAPTSAEQYEPEIAEWLDQIKEIEIQEERVETPEAVIEESPSETVTEEEISWAFEPTPTEVHEPVLHLEDVPHPQDLDRIAVQKPTDPQLFEDLYIRPEPEPVVPEPVVPEPVIPEAVVPEHVIPEAEVVREDRSILSEAQTNLWHGEIDQALSSYETLVKSGKFLEEIIQDMRNALYQHPVDVGLWETLGDAYARNHCLQEALDAYTKAEELIR